MTVPKNQRKHPDNPPREALQASSHNTSRSSREDYILDVLEMAINRDPDQDFELILVLERAKDKIELSERSSRQKK